MSIDSQEARTRGRAVTALLSGLLLCFLLSFYGWHNDFDFYYHTDEPGKVKQVLTGTRNFHHPLLMITATDLVVRVFVRDRTEQNVVETGRWFSAVSAALAAVAMALVTARYCGKLIGFIAGVVLGIHPMLFELAHYMKEDCALMVGVAWSLVALLAVWRQRTLLSVIFLGVASGVAISGKYIGCLILVSATGLVVTLWRGQQAIWSRLLALLAAFALTFLLINYQAVFRSADAVVGVSGDLARFQTLSETGSLVRTNFLEKFPRKVPPVMLPFITIYLAGFIMRNVRRDGFEWALLAFWILYFLAIHFTPLGRERYLLPVIVLSYFMTARGISELLAWIPRLRGEPQRTILAILCWAAIAAFQLPRVLVYQAEFGRDSRREMVEWIAAHLPQNAVIIADRQAKLDEPVRTTHASSLKRTVRQSRLAADFGPIDELKRGDATHVVAVHADYNLLLSNKTPSEKIRSKADFYRELFAREKLVWEKPPGLLRYIHPGLKIYELGKNNREPR